MKKVELDPTLPEMYGKFPRTLEEAFGPGPQSRLCLQEDLVVKRDKKAAIKAAIILILLATFVACHKLL